MLGLLKGVRRDSWKFIERPSRAKARAQAINRMLNVPLGRLGGYPRFYDLQTFGKEVKFSSRTEEESNRLD